MRSRVARGGGGPNRLGAVQHPALRLGPRRNALLGGRISHAMESPAELGATCFRVMPAPRNRRVSNGSTRRGSSRVQLHIPLTLRCGLEVAQRVWCCSRLGGRGSARRGPTGHDDPPRARRCDASARQSPFPKVSTGELGKKPRGGTRCGAFARAWFFGSSSGLEKNRAAASNSEYDWFRSCDRRQRYGGTPSNCKFAAFGEGARADGNGIAGPRGPP